MSYRSLRIRAFQAIGKSCLLSRRWHSTDTDPIRNLATTGSLQAKGGITGNGLHQLEKALREYEEYKCGRAIKHEILSDQDEAREAVRGSRRRETPIPSTQSTFLAEYARYGDTQIRFLPDAPEGQGAAAIEGEISDLRRRMLLRREFLETAPFRLRRRSQLMSRVIQSESRLQDLTKLLYFLRRTRVWARNFGILFHSHRANGREENWRQKLRISAQADEWSQEVYKDGNISEVTDRWSQLSRVQKRARWPHIMLRCLLASAEQALNFILATHVEPLPPVEMVMDALLYLKRERGEEIRGSAELQSRFELAMWRQRQPTRWFYVMQRNHLDLFLEGTSVEEGRELFEYLNAIDTDLSYHCRLIFLDFFTRAGDIDFALKALCGINPEMRQLSRKQLLARCTNLLQLDSVIDDGGSPNFRILPVILEAGIRPDLILHNVVMGNAVKSGVSAVAWDLLRYMQDHNLPTDARTYVVLMKDAVARRDAAGLDEILTAIHTRDGLYTHPHLVVQTLSVIHFIHRQSSTLNPRTVFSKMLAVYNRAFSAAPLKHLRMVGETTEPSSNQSQVEPEVPTVAFVVLAYVLLQRSPMVVQSMWGWVEHLRSEGDGLALSLTQCVPFYDGFISFFSRSKATLPICLEIIRLMLERKVQPSATTWDILATAFRKHGYSQAAKELRVPVDYLEVYRRKTPRSIMKSNPDIDLAVFVDAALGHLEELPGPMTSADKSVNADKEQLPQSEEQEASNAVDDMLHAAHLAGANILQNHQSSSVVVSSDSREVKDPETDESPEIPQFDHDGLVQKESPSLLDVPDDDFDEAPDDILYAYAFVDQNVSEGYQSSPITINNPPEPKDSETDQSRDISHSGHDKLGRKESHPLQNAPDDDFEDVQETSDLSQVGLLSKKEGNYRFNINDEVRIRRVAAMKWKDVKGEDEKRQGLSVIEPDSDTENDVSFRLIATMDHESERRQNEENETGKMRNQGRDARQGKPRNRAQEDGQQGVMMVEEMTFKDTDQEESTHEPRVLEYSHTEVGTDNFLWRCYTKIDAEAAAEMVTDHGSAANDVESVDENAGMQSRESDEARQEDWIQTHGPPTTMGPPKPAGDISKV